MSLLRVRVLTLRWLVASYEGLSSGCGGRRRMIQVGGGGENSYFLSKRNTQRPKIRHFAKTTQVFF